MPERYKAIRDKLMREGMSKKAAQRKAAKIHNATKKPDEPHAGKHSHKRGKK